MKSENDTGFGKEEQEMRYAINSDMIMMYMGMRRMCMRTLCNALNSEPFSTQK